MTMPTLDTTLLSNANLLFRVLGSVFRVEDLGFRGLGFRVLGFGFWAQCFGFRV
jgi:hypothetical protein